MTGRLSTLPLLLLCSLAASEPSVGVANNKTIDAVLFSCPVDCVCRNALSVDCRGSGISNVTDFLVNRPITRLDLGHSDVRQLGPGAFAHLTSLEELNLGGNYLRYIDPEAFRHPTLKSLSLQNVHLNRLPAGLFSHSPNLQSMRLDSNQITHLEPLALLGLTSLRHLRLDVNRFSAVPHEALSRVTSLEYLNLSFNKIKSVPGRAFTNISALVVLMLDHNDIEHIDDEAFHGLHSLKVLELRHNQIKQIRAPHLGHLLMLNELYLNNNNISHLSAGVFQQTPRVAVLELKGNPLASVDHETFAFLPRLQKLILSEVKELRYFPSLNGTMSLELVRVDRARIASLPADLCRFCPYLRSLDVKSNFIASIPDLTRCVNLRLLDMSHNEISRLDEYAFRHQSHLHDLLLSHNRIDAIGEHAFTGLRKLKTLDLSGNFIERIHANAFLALVEIQDVNLGHNEFAVFPSVGLENALHIKVHNNPNLREFPSPASFPRVKTLALSYAYHCCPFQQQPATLASPFNGANGDGSLTDSIIFPSSEHGIDLTAWAKGEAVWVDSGQQWANASQQQQQHQWVNMAALNLSEADIEKLLAKSSLSSSSSSNRLLTPEKSHITCIPEPSPFMPCQDLFDWWSLRCGVWIVFLMALLGNGAVVFVLMFSRSKIDVPRFLVCNLGMADLFMGIYLGFLAVVDASTLGEFRKYAIPWQLSPGCQVAGFFGVLSSELSVFTLAVITMERNYAITHAMHLNKRLSLRHASYIMAAGWLFALVMAILPLVGVSDYRKFAVCLPFEVGTASSMGYVVFLMVINGVAFLILMGCYLKMYCAIRGSQAWNSNDSRIAKRMALLVFTDFLCWAPIAFFSLTAASGLRFISLEEAKIFTVFILPLNSCCNPFLYAILTKQFKKDCVMICKAIEESRVTRGIGRCRHSSNFSNRQTPGNTNSMGDRNSSKDGSSCQCQGRGLLKEDKHSSSSSSNHQHHHHHHHHRYERRPPRRLHWIRSPVRAFLRRIRAGGERQLGGESTSSANEYAYRIAEIQQKQRVQRNKHHRRAESVSSDNFSSSRSDSVKAIGCGLPMRMAGRRRNSWTVTRKPSSDSNLSSSRNDSSTSAMTASTSAGNSTWRNSRSSVSSDGGSIRDRDRMSGGHNKGARGSTPSAPLAAVAGAASAHLPPPTEVHVRRAASVRGEKTRVLPTSPLAAGIVRQQSVATPTGSLVVQRTIITHAHPTPPTPPPTTEPPTPPSDHQTGFSLAVVGQESNSKAKPRLTRQIAVSDEAAVNLLAGSFSKCVSFEPGVMAACSLQHQHQHQPRLYGVWESSVEDDEDDSQEMALFAEAATDDGGANNSSSFAVRPKDRLSLPPTSGSRNRLGLAGFIPRKLSTISSRSCSVNPDGDDRDDQLATEDPAANPLLVAKTSAADGSGRETSATNDNASESHAGLDVRFPPDEAPPSTQAGDPV